MRCSCGDQHLVERRVGGKTLETVTIKEFDRREGLQEFEIPVEVVQRLLSLNGEYLGAHLPEHTGLIGAAGTYFQYPLVRLRVKQLRLIGHGIRL